eukprot:2067168-Prymnesium_polylepis.1
MKTDRRFLFPARRAAAAAMHLAARAPISYAELHQRTIESRRRRDGPPSPRASPFAVNLGG